jgi:hypothetical protein
MSAVRVLRRPVPEEPLAADLRADYADTFDLQVAEPDPRSAEQLARAALEQAPRLVRRVVRTAHVLVLRLRLAPVSSPDHVLGWEVLVREPDAVSLAAESPLLRARIIGRRVDARTARVTTVVEHRSRLARPVWVLVGPLHRAVVPLLLRRAARR